MAEIPISARGNADTGRETPETHMVCQRFGLGWVRVTTHRRTAYDNKPWTNHHRPSTTDPPPSCSASVLAPSGVQHDAPILHRCAHFPCHLPSCSITLRSIRNFFISTPAPPRRSRWPRRPQPNRSPRRTRLAKCRPVPRRTDQRRIRRDRPARRLLRGHTGGRSLENHERHERGIRCSMRSRRSHDRRSRKLRPQTEHRVRLAGDKVNGGGVNASATASTSPMTLQGHGNTSASTTRA